MEANKAKQDDWLNAVSDIPHKVEVVKKSYFKLNIITHQVFHKQNVSRCRQLRRQRDDIDDVTKCLVCTMYAPLSNRVRSRTP